MGELQTPRRSGWFRNGNTAPLVDVESEESEEEEVWEQKSARRMTNASLDAVVHRLASVNLNEKQHAKNVRSSYVQGKSKQLEKDSEIAVVLEEGAMEPTDLSSESSDDDDSAAEEEQKVLDRSLTNEGAALLADVERVLAEGGALSKLRLDHLKAYLRHHGLRIGGIKAVLVSRIEDHLRLKDGQGERLYPRSSFKLNCKGDVCIGDIVLFRHTAYDNPNNKRYGKALGDRWVAGRVVNESYGARKQQHTFTIEVFWSAGIRPFYILQPIQIKGRNLYRLITMRQPWNNEADRLKALEEKYSRGDEARSVRARRIGTRSSSTRDQSRPKPKKGSQSNNQGGSIRPPYHTNSVQQPREETRMESDKNGVRHPYQPNPMQQPRRELPRMESDKAILHKRDPIPRFVPIAKDQALERILPPFVPIGCSTQGCERAGALKCIVRSCGPCCSTNMPRGSCPRHLELHL